MAPKLIRLTSQQERLLSGPPETVGIKSGHMVLDSGAESGRHTTGAREEILIIRSGSGLVEVQGHPNFAINPNVTLYIPPETWHNVKNNSQETLDYIYVVSPIKLS